MASIETFGLSNMNYRVYIRTLPILMILLFFDRPAFCENGVSYTFTPSKDLTLSDTDYARTYTSSEESSEGTAFLPFLTMDDKKLGLKLAFFTQKRPAERGYGDHFRSSGNTGIEFQSQKISDFLTFNISYSYLTPRPFDFRNLIREYGIETQVEINENSHFTVAFRLRDREKILESWLEAYYKVETYDGWTFELGLYILGISWKDGHDEGLEYYARATYDSLEHFGRGDLEGWAVGTATTGTIGIQWNLVDHLYIGAYTGAAANEVSYYSVDDNTLATEHGLSRFFIGIELGTNFLN